MEITRRKWKRLWTKWKKWNWKQLRFQQREQAWFTFCIFCNAYFVFNGNTLSFNKYYNYKFHFLFKVKVISPNLWRTSLTKCLMLLINCTQLSNSCLKFTSLSVINKWLKGSSWLCISAFSPKILNQRDGLRGLQITYQVVVSKIS